MKSRFFVGRIFVLLLFSLFLFSCSHDSNESGTGEPLLPLPFHEHDLVENPDLVVTSDQVVVVDLEPPNSVSFLDNDTATAGIDQIPISFPKDVTHDFIVEYKEGEAFVVELYDQNGDRLAILDRNSPTCTQNIFAGEYFIKIIHGGGVETIRTLFVRPGSTYIGRDCPGCFLKAIDLPDTDLRGIDLSGADLSYSNLAGSDLSGADLSYADFTGSDLTGADLTGAELTGATFDLISVSVSNAGIVLAQGFFETLFERLGLLNDGGFRSAAEKQKAVHVLQYLATGEKLSRKNNLMLNKVLCGYSINDPVETTIALDESETEIIDSLIESLINYWPAIGSSSIDGFRGNWFVRDGTLSEDEERWNLMVEKRAYDVLLVQSPFSYSVISFKWMNKPLYVTWPH